MKFSRVLAFCVLGMAAILAVTGTAQTYEPLVEPFSKLVGDTKVGKVEATDPTPLPYLTWGGDVATFHGNGGLTTAKDSVFAKQGLNFKLTNGDNFVQQVKDYMSGKTPYLRGTFTQIGQASEVLNSDPATKPVTILQLTWSGGDHMVGRAETKNLNNVKGKTICLQQGGPHVGLVDDALRAAGLKWSDVTIKWVKDLSGKDGPAEAFKADSKIDLCCVISPDMIGLTGGLDQTGSGGEGTVKGAHVVVSTASMSHSIADVYCVRSDYFKDNRAKVEKFVAGYIKATEELVAMKKKYADGKGKSPEYISVLKMTQKIYGEKVLPTIEVDAHGLVSDASFVSLSGPNEFNLTVGIDIRRF
jgi:ABC-type nitrate/sulfonate/bicarbonate transport system substrate-binding protein